MSSLPHLPLPFDVESQKILKKLAIAHSALAELKGIAEIIPNKEILIQTLSLQEAKESSAIENIITSHDELYKSDQRANLFATAHAKEVYNYAAALQRGYAEVQQRGLLTRNTILEIQGVIVENGAGFRTLPGTELRNDRTGEIVYTPPQEAGEVESLMHNLETFMNDSSLADLDPLTKMAIIHHQFESIHPFYDGNGRTGRILNVLYLVKEELLDTPILYLSRYINQQRSEYYRLLQLVREENSAWEEWILYMLEAVRATSKQTTRIIREIATLMHQIKHRVRNELPRIYSQDLLNNLFQHPYTKIEFLTYELGIHRNTAKKYLDELTNIEILAKHKMGRDNFYVNTALFDLLRDSG